MSKGAVNFSTDNEYYTPKEIVSLFGSFDYDPATTEEKAKDLGVSHYDTIDTNGLLSDWAKTRNHQLLVRLFFVFKIVTKLN